MGYKVENYETDVLVAGGGIAGSLAAIHAREQGAEVIVLERANTYRSGFAGSGIDHLFSYVPPVHEKAGYTKDDMKNDMVKGGFTEMGLGDRAISDHFVDVSYERIMSLEKYGVKLRFKDAHLPEGFRLVPQFHSVPTSINFEGRDLKVKLTEAMKNAGVKIFNHAVVVEILKDESGSAAGAIAVSSREDKLIVVKAKAVVLSVNNSNIRLGYQVNVDDPHYERPSSSCSGFGISLPLRAGAEVANLEFLFGKGELAFYGFSTRVGSPGSSWWPAARVVDDDGSVVVRRIEDYHIDEPGYLEKNIKQYAEFMEEFYSMHRYLAEGRQLYMDFEEASDEEMEYIRWSLSHEGRCWLFIQNLKRAGINLKEVQIPYKFDPKICFLNEYAGVLVNERCETSIKGLYAAGDTMGVTGGSGPIAVVYGIEAGIQAGRYVKQKQNMAVIDEGQVRRILQLVESIRENKEGESWKSVEKAIRGIATTFAGKPLTDTKIRHALALIRDLKAHPNLKADNPHETARAMQVLSLIDVAEAMYEAAWNRKESFGSYFRVRNYRESKEEQKKAEKTVLYTVQRSIDGVFSFHTHNYLNH